MRLICPGCQAHYEIDPTLLPQEGREVQCSACNFIWFQPHPEAPPPEADIAEAAPEIAPTAIAPTPAAPEGQHARPEQAPHSSPAPDNPAAQPAETAPRTVSGPALEILREEAAFEARLRAAEARAPQDDMAQSLAPSWPSTAPQPQPQHDNQPPAADAANRPNPANFPDIDDISATLEPIDTSRAGRTDFDLPATAAAKWRSFLRGFAVPVGLAALAAAPYLLAPELSAALPAAEGALSGYVAAVDALRMKLAGLVAG